MAFETLTVRREGAVLFAEILSPPMNLLGPDLVRDLVSSLSALATVPQPPSPPHHERRPVDRVRVVGMPA